MSLFHRKTTHLKKRRIVNMDQPQSFAAEQFRTLRTNLSFSSPMEELASVMVTSAGPAEGKSTVASNLAAIYAKEGKKVLLIDADMRKPTMHYTFQLRNNMGLSSVLTRHASLKSAIKRTSIDQLHVLTAGPIPPNPAELLNQPTMDVLMKEAGELYQMIIIDAPPILSFADAQVIGHKCKNALLVLYAGKTTREEALKAKEAVELVHCTLLGTVMNKLEQRQNKAYYETYAKHIR